MVVVVVVVVGVAATEVWVFRLYLAIKSQQGAMGAQLLRYWSFAADHTDNMLAGTIVGNK